MSGGHGFLPDPLVENDAPVCEICGEDFSEHGHYALYVQETDRERASLEARLGEAEAALEKIATGYLPKNEDFWLFANIARDYFVAHPEVKP